MTTKKSAPKNKSAAGNSAPKGLGKGLSALLGDNAAIASMSSAPKGLAAGSSSAQSEKTDQAGGNSAQKGGAQIAPIDTISPSPYQPRVNFDEDSLNDLVESIKQHGVVQPLLVRRVNNGYELIAGERRWRAAQKAGLHDIPIVERDADDQMAAEIAMIENIQRHDLSVIEEAEGYRRLIDEFNYTQDALATVIGKSRSHLANTMRLLNLPDMVQAKLAEGKLTAGQVRPLVGRDDAEALARLVEAKAMSARQVEALIAKQDKPKTPKAEKSADLIVLEHDLAALTGFDIEVNFNAKQEKGSIVIKANDLGQFDAIIDKLKS